MQQAFSCLVLVVVLEAGACGSAVAAGDDIAELAAQIKKAQSELRNFDVVVRVLRYSVDSELRLTERNDIQCEFRRFVVNGDRFYSARDFLISTAGGQAIRRHERHGFNGEENWSLVGQGRRDGAPPSSEASLPSRHDLLISQLLGDLSLTDALLVHDVQIEDEASFDGVSCQVLLINQLSGRRVRVWLAPTRDYIPLKVEVLAENGAATQAIASGFVSDWSEVTAGVWFPRYIQVLTERGTVTELFIESLTVADPSSDVLLAMSNVGTQAKRRERTERDDASRWLLSLPAWVWMLIINNAIIVALLCYFVARVIVIQVRSRVTPRRL